jgi:hypothetical protein
MTIASINEVRLKVISSHGPTAVDRGEQERIDAYRRRATEPRQPMNKVMITDRTGMTHDIKTGRPPTMKAEAREAWLRAREELSIEKLFR